MKKTLPLALFLFTQMSFANVGAVIDSGVDFTHDKLKSKTWVNAKEIPGNEIDDDLNGKKDDINGWNYVVENGEVFDYKIIFSEAIYGSIIRFFALQDKYERGVISIDEMAELRGINTNIKADLNRFGENSHGTHVAGIMTNDNDQSKVIALKIISTDLENFVATETEKIMAEEKPVQTGSGLQRFIMRFIMKRLGGLKARELGQYGMYISSYDARVANCSWGSSYQDMQKAVRSIAERVFCKKVEAPVPPGQPAPTPVQPGKDEKEEVVVYKCDTPDGEPVSKVELDMYTGMLMKKLNKKGERMMDYAKNTLFVFAAGNDGTDNDVMPSYPANIEDTNTITVAATVDDYALAEFSNYGAKSVDVAAPGVGILSTTPQNKMCMMTGTSQATPYVTNIALKSSEINPKLSAKEIKKIILKTVDQKKFLIGKVSTAGVVNMKRALLAAELSKSMSVSRAIRKANREIPALISIEREPFLKRLLHNIKVMQAPSFFRSRS